MNAIQHNRYTEAWSAIGRELPRPRSILCVSAHWYTRGSALTINTAPETIHDFGGFPRELYRVQYPAPGDPELARRVQKLLSPVRAELSSEWGLDHGAWSVLQHVYPNADVPVVQLSIDAAQPAPFHYEVGRRLEELRQEGVLILGSGNVVHNLRAYDQTGTADDGCLHESWPLLSWCFQLRPGSRLGCDSVVAVGRLERGMLVHVQAARR